LTGGLLAVLLAAAVVTPVAEIVGAPVAAAGVGKLQPVPATTDVYGVACPSGTTCYAVGAGGAVVTIDDGTVEGAKFAAVDDLDSIACWNADDCVAVGLGVSGEEGVVVPVTAGVPGKVQTVSVEDQEGLYTVACETDSAAATCVAGGRSTYPGGTGVVATIVKGLISASVLETGTSLFLGSACDARSCVLVGTNLEPPVGTKGTSGGQIGTTVPVNGTTVESEVNIEGTEQFWGAGCAPNGSVCYAGDQAYQGPQTVASIDPSSGDVGGGVADSNFSELNGIACTSSTSCWLAGFATSGGGEIAQLVNGSPSGDQTVDGADIFNAVACSSQGTCEAVGTNNFNPGSEEGEALLLTSCEQDNDVPDGDWAFGGCFTQPDKTDYDSSQPSTLDGLVVQPESNSTVDYSDGGASGDDLTSKGPATVSVAHGKVDTEIFSGTLKWPLSGPPVELTLPKGVTLAGFKISGKLTLTPSGGGKVEGKASTTLPGPLGGGTADLSFSSAYGKGLTAMTVKVDHASLAKLFDLSNVVFNWSPKEWTVSAKASIPTGQTADLSGKFTYAGNMFTSATIGFAGLSIAGLVDIKTFTVTYSTKDGWGGTADFAQGDQKADISLSFDKNGALTAGSLHTSGPFSLFGVLELKKFNMDYKSGTWSLDVEPVLKGGTPVDVALQASGGSVTGAELKFGKVGFENLLTIDSVDLKYSSANGVSTYKGAAKVTLPGPQGAEIEGAFTFTGGQFTEGSVTISKLSVPLGAGVFLTKLSASIKKTPFEIKGGMGLSAGPVLPKIGHLVGLDGTLTYDAATSSAAAKYDLDGKLTIGSIQLGEGDMTLQGSSATIVMALGDGLGKGFHFGSVAQLDGDIRGDISASSMTVNGKVTFTILSGPLKGDQVKAVARATSKGLAACGIVNGTKSAGFVWLWGQSTPKLYSNGCTLSTV